MKRRLSTWGYPPRGLRSVRTRMDNVALVPASELASLEKWKARAQQLPIGETLLVIPHDSRHLYNVGRNMARSLASQGLPTRLMSTGSKHRLRR